MEGMLYFSLSQVTEVLNNSLLNDNIDRILKQLSPEMIKKNPVPTIRERWSPSQVKALNEWYGSKKEDPYIKNEAELQVMVEKTGLNRKQVMQWLSNKRQIAKKNTADGKSKEENIDL
jgi:hypothetical protein